jgi:hypothetical protein
LAHHPKDQPARILRRGNAYVSAVAQRFTRLPSGHPEAFIEAFANIYTEVARAICERLQGNPTHDYDFPTVEDGVVGMAFIETAVRSANSGEKWTPLRAD